MAIEPIDTSDGQLASASSAPQVPGRGYGPSASPTTQLNVVAPLSVNAAPTSAAKLAQALNVAWGQTEPAVLRKARMQGSADEAQGEGDASLNQVDDALMQQNAGYRVGATRVVAQQHAQQAIDAFKQQANSDPDLANLSALDSAPGANDGLVSKADAFFQQQLGGLEKDPISARAITPMLTQFMGELAGQRLQQQAQNTQKQAVSNAVTQASTDASTGLTTFDYGYHLDTLKKLFGGDGVAANNVLSQSLIDCAIADHNPKVLDLIPQTVVNPDGTTRDGPATSPETALKIADARQKISVLSKDDNRKVVNAAQLSIMNGVLSGHDPTAALHQYAQIPDADPRFLESAMGFYHSLGDQQAADSLDSSAAAGITAGIAKGTISSPAQLLQAAQQAGFGGKALSLVVSRGLSTIGAVRSDTQDDPTFRSNVQYIDSIYKPGTNPMTGKFMNPAAVTQHAGVLVDFRSEYEKLVGQGKSPEDASHTALQSVQEKYGKPVEDASGNLSTNHALPLSDPDQVNVITRASGDPAAFYRSRTTAADITRLRQLGMVGDAEATTAYKLLIAAHNKG